MSEKKKETGRVQLPTNVEELTRRVAAIERNFALLVVDLSEEQPRRTDTTGWVVLIGVYFLLGMYLGRQLYGREEGKRRRE